MFKAIFSKVMWLGKATTFTVGLAVILALTVGFATTVLAANGNPFVLGKSNTATKVSKLIKSGVGPALELQVGSGAPLKVNSETKVDKLNADTVDGRDAPLWAHVHSDGTLVRGDGANYSGRFSTGYYFVSFNRDVSFCGYVATTTDAYATPTGTLQGASYGQPREVTVYTVDSTGTRVDVPFHLVVTC
jgi:hypothetical protein